MNQPLLWRKRRIFTIFTLICCLSLSVPLSILWTNRYVIPFEVDQEVYLNNNNRHTVNGTIYRDRDDPFANAFTQKWKGFSLKDSLSFSSSVPFSALVERVIAKAKIKDKIVWRSSSEYPLHCGNYRDLLNITTEVRFERTIVIIYFSLQLNVVFFLTLFWSLLQSIIMECVRTTPILPIIPTIAD